MSRLYVLSHFQARPLLVARDEGVATATTSLDLNMTTIELQIMPEHVSLPDGQVLRWEVLEAVAADESGCFYIEDNEAHKIQFFSQYLNRAYTLYPTLAAPTILISGLPMHRIKGTDPVRDTEVKVGTIRPVTGRVLDTALGLGYTAIKAAETAGHVTTIELGPTVVEVCCLNPWSQALFHNPRITRHIGDTFDVIKTLEDSAFSRIIHDPPTFSLAGRLYSEGFYRELYRVLMPHGQLFHYIGDLESRSGAGVARGVRPRLKAAGFRRIMDQARAFGVVAYK